MADFSTVVTCKCRKSGVLAGCLTHSIGEQQLKMQLEMHCFTRQATDGGRASVPLCYDVPGVCVILSWWLAIFYSLWKIFIVVNGQI